MFLSKIWFVLVGLLAGVATTAAFVSPRAADRKLVEMEGQRLDRAQYAAEQMLRADAHRWIDYAAKLARDANLIESLEAASKGSGEPRMLSETVKTRIKGLVPDPKSVGIESVGAVDNKGRVVARIGERESEHGDPIGGIEVIADALRGYLSDDVWGTGGKLQRMAAVPVLSKSRDRIVGALFVGAEAGKRLAEVWKKNLGVDVAILLKGQVVASTVPEAVLSELPRLVEQRAAELAEHKRTRPVPLTVGADRLFAMAAPFAGVAAEQGGLYALIDTLPPASDPLGLLTSTTADDLRWGQFPWVPLGGGLLVILGVGLFLQRTETEKPIARLRAEMQKLAKGEIQKLPDTAFPGRFGGIARDVNAAMERFTHAPAPKSETQKKDMGAILGPAGAEGSVFDLPAASPFGSTSGVGGAGSIFRDRTPTPTPFAPPPPGLSGSTSSPGFGGGPPAVGAPPAFGGLSGFGGGGAPVFGTPSPLAPPSGLPPLAPADGKAGGGTPAAALGAGPGARLGAPAGAPGPGRPPAPPVPGAGAPPPVPRFGATTPAGAAGFGGIGLGGAAAAPPPPAAAPLLPDLSPAAGLGAGRDPDSTPVERLGAAARPAGAPGSAPFGEPIDDDTTSEMKGESTRAVDPEEAHMREVFAEYVATREKCGEPIGNLTIEKFRAKLEDNRQQLIAKYNCKTARFSVYVKDGKAAIKATPVR
jgi:hypothetical protein